MVRELILTLWVDFPEDQTSTSKREETPSKVVDPEEETVKAEDTDGPPSPSGDTEPALVEWELSRPFIEERRMVIELELKQPRRFRPNEEDHEHDKLKFQHWNIWKQNVAILQKVPRSRVSFIP